MLRVPSLALIARYKQDTMPTRKGHDKGLRNQHKQTGLKFLQDLGAHLWIPSSEHE